MTERCTRCKGEAPIRTRDTLEFQVPFQLCGRCWDQWCHINQDDVEDFVADLWRKAAAQSVEMIRSMKPQGTA